MNACSCVANTEGSCILCTKDRRRYTAQIVSSGRQRMNTYNSPHAAVEHRSRLNSRIRLRHNVIIKANFILNKFRICEYIQNIFYNVRRAL